MREMNKTETFKYSGMTILLFFFLFSYIGWVWEGFFVGLRYGEFINRGFLNGPWLPIYGVGCVLMIVLLTRFQKNPFAIFAGSFAVCGIAEYVTSVGLEVLFHQRWWDYSDCFMNLQGRVCVQTLIPFGIVGIVVVCIAAPFIEKIIKKIPTWLQKTICVLLIIAFIADLVFSIISPNVGIGITY